MRRWGITAVLCCLCLLLIVSVGLTQRARRGRAGRGRGRAAGGAATLASPVIQGPVHVTPDAIAVRILLGQGDQAPTDWDGSLTVNNGTLLRVEGWRFRQQDQMAGTAAWRARSRRAPQRGGGQQNGAVTPTGVVATLKTTPQTQVQVNTPRGNFSFRTADLAWGKATPFLAGAVQVDLVPAEFQVTGAATEDDFPAATASTDGNVWVAYTSYQYGEPTLPYARGLQEEPKNFDFLRPHGNGDQVRLGRLAKDAEGATFTTVANLTEAAQDVLHPAIAADSTGKVWTVWSQNVAGNWDLYARSYSNGNLSPVYRLTTDPGPDLNPALARDAGGNIYLAWQGFRNGQSDIFLASLAPNAVRWAGPTLVSNSPRNDWEPQLACAGDGTVWIAWDTYDKGDYDVRLRSYSRGQLGNVINVTDSPRFEARPSIVCDPQNRVWLAWEEAPPLWGKDFGFVVQNQGIPLYRGHTVNLKCFVNGQPYHTAGDLAAVLPGGPVQPRAGQGRLGQAARAGAVMQASMPRLWIDAKGRIYLTYRRGAPNLQAPIGTTWLSFVTSYDGNAWTPAAPAPQSDGLLDVRPAFVSSGPGGALYMVHSADGRNHAFGTDPRYEIYISPIAVNAGTAQAATPQLIAETPPAPRAPDTAATAEAANVARMRAVRSIVGSKTYHLLRGDFHRHTEISPDGGGDGPLIDMYRYAIDAAAQDWICAGDHDYGNGREYTWWLIQQLDDAFHVGPQFVPMFGYERSVRYPDGHRNVMFTQRGIRALPRLVGTQGNGVSPNDTKMLYSYLRFFDGICASHTSATDMGTDWRDNDPKLEPVVEIYQGDRQNYEYEGAPRSPSQGNAPGGYRPAGFVWNAFTKGYRFGFESSSDHISTHISYMVVYAEQPTREAIMDATKKRHTYGATDNIVLEVRSGEHLMGDEFTSNTAPRLQIHAVGTGRFARMIVVKDNKVVYTATPNQQEIDTTWMDNEAKAGGTSYYYVRLEQEDGQLAWASPMWITYQP